MRRSTKGGAAWWAAERRLERLVEMRHAGVTYSRIAVTLGTTKSACISQANRLGMCQPASSKRQEMNNTNRQSDQKFTFPTDEQCCWPMWDQVITHEYCRAPVDVVGLPYCREHVLRAYAKGL